MSIIRFRTAVRDVQDIVFIFFALAVGMAAGVGLHAIAISGTLIICLVTIILVTFNFGTPGRTEYVIQLVYAPSEKTDKIISEVLEKFCRRIKLVNLKTHGDNGNMDALYQFTLRRKFKNTDMVKALSTYPDLIKFNLYFDQDEPNISF
jgi:uncharacterized membrane protein YhiD involved in acid resistance